MIKKISITGGIGSGKSTVANILQKFGYCVLDADGFVAEALTNLEVEEKLKNLFGTDAYIKIGVPNRDFIRSKAFANQKQRLQLEEILHPIVKKMFEDRVNLLQSNNISCWVFYEASLIFEKNLQNFFDANILVSSDDHIRSQRIQTSRNLSEDIINQIILQQMPTEEKKQFADFIIENLGNFSDLEDKVIDLIKFLKNKF